MSETRKKRHSLPWERFTKKETRCRLYCGQNGACFYCKQKVNFDVFTIDHVVSISKGGDHRFTNLVGACNDCNQKKGNA